jgi:predicted peptidase
MECECHWSSFVLGREANCIIKREFLDDSDEKCEASSFRRCIKMPVSNYYFTQEHSSMGFKLFLPNNYNDHEDQSFPLILFLHGIKRRGNDLSLLDDYGLLEVADQSVNFPYIVVAPQCPSDTYWPENRLIVLSLLNQILEKYQVDQNSIYLTGFSMGGNGVWDLAAKDEGLFAAAVPVSGWYEANAAIRLCTMPIWAFHGENDDIVSISSSETMVNAITEAGGAPLFTRYPGLTHNVMHETYTNPQLYDWLMRNKKQF